jgi:hypothetical protein
MTGSEIKFMILTPNKYFVYLSWIMTTIKGSQSGKRHKYDPTVRWLYSKAKLHRQLSTCSWSSIDYSYFESPRGFAGALGNGVRAFAVLY